MEEVPSLEVPKMCQDEVKMDAQDKIYEPGFVGGDMPPSTVPHRRRPTSVRDG